MENINRTVVATEGNCGTNRGVSIYISDDIAKRMIGRTITHKTKQVLLTEENINQYLHIQTHLRIPILCDYDEPCNVCCGI